MSWATSSGTVAQGIWVYEPTGTLLGILALPKRPSNLAWCGPEANQLAITAVDQVFRVRLNVTGKAPAFLPRRLHTDDTHRVSE